MTRRARRPTVEVIVLILTGTVAVSILGAGVAIMIVEVVNPATDTSDAVRGLASVIGAILSALLGLLAGRSLNGRDKGGDG